MKILLAGSNRSMAIERHYVHYLRLLGADVLHYPSADIAADFYGAGIVNKLLFKTGIYTGYKPVNEALINKAYAYSPDLILVFKGMEIFPETLEKLGKDFRLANYNPDHPFIIVSKGSGNNNVTSSVGLYHCHFCYNRQLQQEIETKFNIPTVFLPFGFELPDSDYPAVSSEPEMMRACFLGNPDETRRQYVLALAQNGVPVDVYGHGWAKTGISKQAGVQVFDAVYGLECWKKLHQYRLQINIFRKHNNGSHNMRTFEIPAAGGIELSPFSEEQAGFFKEDQEIFFYNSREELISKAKKILAMTDTETATIRNAARKRSVQSGYRYADRAATVYGTAKKMME